MKNLFVLRTNKSSRLFIYDGKLGLAKGFQYGSDAIQNQKIHITNEEKTKYGDWCIDLDSYFVFKFATEYKHKRVKKIILTTDQKLINYNIQAIPDEFLEWFVKNTSCEEVEVKCYSKFNDGDFTDYKIIISKQEAKQEKLKEVPTELDSVLAKITHQNDLGLSQWYEVVYYDNKWCSYSGSKTFEDGERVVEWKYCKELI